MTLLLNKKNTIFKYLFKGYLLDMDIQNSYIERQ